MDKKTKLVMMKGIQGSGKSHYAKELVSQGYKRVNKDELRAMVDNSVWSKMNEEQIIESRDLLIIQYLDNGYNVVVDDTNFAPIHEVSLREIAENCDAEFEVKFINTPIMTCLARNTSRPDATRVPEKKIWELYERYVMPTIKRPNYNKDLPDAYIFDIDGTLAKMTGRSPHDYTRVNEDRDNENVSNVLDQLKLKNKIIIVSGRKDECQEVTEGWLHDNDMHYDGIYLRETGDDRNDSIVKEEIYKNNIEGKYNIMGVFDDRDRVVQMWRNLGLTCFQVDYGPF